MIFVVSGIAAEPVSADDRARDELDFTSLRLELLALREVEVSGVAVELDEFAAIRDELLEDVIPALDECVVPAPEPESPDSLLRVREELESSSAEALFPSSPQATNPNATANTPNKPKSFIFPSLFMVNIIEISLKSCRPSR